jgi:hypothetical protein
VGVIFERRDLCFAWWLCRKRKQAGEKVVLKY